MKILTWNVRGLNTPNKRRFIKSQLNAQQSEIIWLQETKLGKDKSDLFIKHCKGWKGHLVKAISASGGIEIMWKESKIDMEP